jgi:hypothetical protein
LSGNSTAPSRAPSPSASMPTSSPGSSAPALALNRGTDFSLCHVRRPAPKNPADPTRDHPPPPHSITQHYPTTVISSKVGRRFFFIIAPAMMSAHAARNLSSPCEARTSVPSFASLASDEISPHLCLDAAPGRPPRLPRHKRPRIRHRRKKGSTFSGPLRSWPGHPFIRFSL